MDEFSSDETVNFNNKVVGKEEATKKFSCRDVVEGVEATLKNLEYSINVRKGLFKTVNEKRRSVQHNFLWPKKESSSDVGEELIDLEAESLHFKTNDPPLKLASNFMERRLQYCQPLIRKHLTQEEIALDRECKKLKIVWANRGLPVDENTVRSAAKKDTFDMSDLSESLPSTSTSGKQLKVFNSRKLLLRGLRFDSTVVRQPTEREETLHSLKRHEQSIHHLLDENKKIALRLKHALEWAQKYISLKKKHSASSQVSSAALGQKAGCDEQKAANKQTKSLNMEKAVRNLSHKDQEMLRPPNICPGFAEMSLDDKPFEKQTSSPEKRRKSIVFPPLLKSCRDRCHCRCRSTKKINFRDFQGQKVNLRVPLNSPIKKEEGGFKSDESVVVRHRSYMRTISLSRQKECIQLSREHSKITALNTHRRVFPGHAEAFCKSECKNSFSKQALILNPVSVPDPPELKFRLIWKSQGETRTYHWPSLGEIKPDKVVPE